MTLGQRLKLLRKRSGQTGTQVAIALGITKGAISQFENDKNEPSTELLSSIAKLYSTTIDHLVAPSSPLDEELTSEQTIAYNQNFSEDLDSRLLIEALPGKGKNSYVPYFDLDVTAGRLDRYFDVKESPTGYIYAPEFADCVACKVYGDSMYNRILPGATVFVRKINNLKYIDYGQVYVVVTEEFRLLKYVEKHQDGNLVILSSENQDKKRHADFAVEKKDILNLLLVKGYWNQISN
jgi:transcriptional regulator with XRE-family HTH domain